MKKLKIPIFTGTSTAIITPFKDGKIDFECFGKLLKIQRDAGVAAITVCGTTGEAAAMTFEERIAAVRFCRENAGNMKIIAGAGSNSTDITLSLIRDAAYAGADAVLVVTPYYSKPTQSGLIEHFSKAADHSPVPLILYNVPSRTGVTLTAESYRLLSQIDNINGVKEASGDFRLFIDTLRLCGDDLNVWSGNDDVIVPMMSLGAKGVISVAANIIPRTIAEITALMEKGSVLRAAALQIKYSRLINDLFIETNPIPVKSAMSYAGLCRGELRLPMTPLSEKSEKSLKNTLKSYGLV